ncbi:hypothetical protein [Haloarchaeobius sp. HRN-SO-5]|uniref:hypothetical protein n=1 Tax=Haloarchaeobius sp. HRN-SO-5 TaxID=3446118 RepID=UPI003EB812B0
MTALELQVIDSFLLNYNVGQALLLVFILSILGTLPLKSMKTIGLTVVAFGAIFVLTPTNLAPVQYRFLGIALLIVGPMLVVMAND